MIGGVRVGNSSHDPNRNCPIAPVDREVVSPAIRHSLGGI
jgi:hypothetical protein